MDKIYFGNRSQPFYELSPNNCRFRFDYLDTSWVSLMHFFVVMSFKDLDSQVKLMEIKDLRELIRVAKTMGFKNIEVHDSDVFLTGIHEAFFQDERRAFILMSTGSAELIFNGPKSFLTENNRYGRILMRMRHIIAEELKG